MIRLLSYEELLNKYNCLLKENKELKNEIEALKSRLRVSSKPKETTILANDDRGINKYSSANNKIFLFRSLFCGREDVFARRWYSKATEKSGFQPVCENEWADGLCNKRKYKCAACPNRKLLPLSDEDIYKHLEGKDVYGRDVIGIYPMLPNDTCCFVCADFDDCQYEKDALSFCVIKSIIERGHTNESL